MKKLISLILVFVMTMNLFSGCGLSIKRKTSGESSASGSESDSSGDTTGVGSGGSGGFTVEAPGPENSFYRYLGEYKQTADLSGLTGRGLPPETPRTGPVGKWTLGAGVEIPAPAINPLGSQELYSYVLYYGPENPNNSAYSDFSFTYVQDFAAVDMNVSGVRWSLEFSTNGGDVLPFMRDYAKSLGAEILESPYDDEVVFTLKQPDAYYWCKAHANKNDVEIEVVKRRVYHVNQEYKITAADFDKDGECTFLVEMPGKKFTTMNVGLPTGSFRFTQYDNVPMNADKTYYNFYTYVYAEEYTQYTFYDFPQDPGLRWVEMDNSKDVTEITICFRETEYDLPGYKPGGQGTLVVKNAPNGKVSVMPQKHVTITDGLTGARHEYYRNGASSPGGYGVQIGDDVYFNLPAGYYTLNEYAVFPGEYASLSSKSQLIPVSAGEQTTVTLPGSWRTASNALNSGSDDRELTGSITIGETKDLTQTAELALSVSDPQGRDVFPTKENTVITEGGKKVEIVDIRREVAPCSVALVIDSSGSMAEDMKPTIEAAQRFVESLPDSCFIKIVDFAGYVRALPGATKAEALRALAGIQSAGSTMLYDAALEGLKQVEGKTRPAVVVFTDGVDSRESPGTGKGSASTKDAVVKRIQDTGIPVYTIGFGKRLNEGENITDVDGAPDIACLIEFAAVSGGEYYPAKNPDALDAVFKAIGSKLGNNFVVTYNRPTENNISDTPVYSMVIDNSGSMSMAPREDGETGFRMEKTKQMLADFIGKLPDKAITQLMTFQGGGATWMDINHSQMSTAGKVNMIKAIGEMTADGGTPIVTALKSAYENIISVPTSKRVIIFLTDCGLQDSDYGFGDKEYYKLLEKIKDKGIYVLWVGMGVDTPEWQARFAEAAERTNGEYVVSESTADIMKAMEVLLKKIAQPGEDHITPITVDLSYKTEDGELVTYKAQGTADFAPPAKKGTPVEPESIKIETGKKLNVQGAAPGAGGLMATAAQRSAGLSGTDSVLHGSGPVQKTMRNNAMEMTVKEISYFDKLMELEAFRNNYRFAALDIELRNITEQKIEYQIPSIFAHFYMGIDGGLYPASKATWLMEKPVTLHGDPSVKIPAGGTVAGTLVFLIPYGTKGYNQVSLHFYDTKFGHIQMPIVGGALDKWQELEKLPESSPGKISDAFTMNVTASEMKTGIDQYKPGDNAAFRVVEAGFKTNVQALLDINPAERVYLRYPSESGDLLTAMSGVTKYMPFGFHGEIMLGPASDNMVRLAYDVPKPMENYESELYFDLAAGTAAFPVSQGAAYGAPAPAAEFDTEFVKVRVNQLTQLQEDLIIPLSGGGTKPFRKGRVLLDVTFIDKPSGDGMDGTRIPQDFFTLVNKNYQPPQSNAFGAVTGVTAGRIGIGGGAESKELMNPSRDNEGLIFGIGGYFGIFGNMSRRAVVIFDDPGSDIADWTLQSKYYESVYAPVTAGDFASPELIAYQAHIPEKDDFQKQLGDAANAAVKKYAALYGGHYNTVVRLDASDGEAGKQSVDAPSINTYGIRLMESLKTEEDFIGAMRGVSAIPKSAGYSITDAVYAPESVVTQGFGDIGSVTNTAAVLLTRLGFAPDIKRLALTDQGKKALKGYYKFDVDASPTGIAYQNEKGERKMFVVPFMADISELKGFVYIPTNSVLNSNDRIKNSSATVKVYVQYMAKATDDAAIGGGGLWGGLSDSLGGGEAGERLEEKLMLEKKLPLSLASTDAIDIGFAAIPSNEGSRYAAFISAPDGIIWGAERVPASGGILGIKIAVGGVNGVSGDLTHFCAVSEGQTLDRYLISAAINLPDLPERAAGEVFRAFADTQKSVENPDPITVAKWYNRNVLYNFIAGQTAFDTEIQQGSELVLGRLNRPRTIIVSSELNKAGGMTTWIDLMQPFNEIHAGDDELRKGYSLVSGLYMSELESSVFPGPLKTGYLDLWAASPPEAVILTIPVISGGRDDTHAAMSDVKVFPQTLLDAVKRNEKVILVQSMPTGVYDDKHYAWLEIDPNTWQAISVFGNGYHGGMAEFGTITTATGEKTLQYVKGAWLGLNVSVWSVCAFSLELSNYKQIMAQAKAFAFGVGETLEEFLGMMDQATEMKDKLESLDELDLDRDPGEVGASERGVGPGHGAPYKERWGTLTPDDTPQMPDAPGELPFVPDEEEMAEAAREKLSEVLFEKLPEFKIFGVNVTDKLKEGIGGFSDGFNDAVTVFFNVSGG